MDKSEELKKKFIKEYKPHSRMPMYPIEMVENKCFETDLDTLLDEYAQQASRDNLESFMKLLDIKEDRKVIRKLRRFIKSNQEESNGS